MFFNKVIYDQNNKPSEIELICNKCGKYIKVTDIDLFDRIQPEYCIISHGENIVCCGCGNSSGDGLIEYKKLTPLQKHNNTIDHKANIPRCPTCSSTRVKRISTTAKVAGAATFGFFSKTARSQFKCENCGYKW